MPAAAGKVPAVFRRPPIGIDAQHPINALAPPPPPGDPDSVLTAPAKFWVQHSLYPTIKKACGTKDAPGIRKQNASRVLSELRQARSVVEDQLEDFHRGMLELDAWIASTAQQSAATSDATNTTNEKETSQRRKKKRRRKSSTSYALPGEVDAAPSFDVDAMDMDAPCTTTECWQYLRATSFFQTLNRDAVDHVLAPLPTAFPDVVVESTTTADHVDADYPKHDDATSTRTSCLSEKLLAALVDVHRPSPTTSMPDECDDEDGHVPTDPITNDKKVLAEEETSAQHPLASSSPPPPPLPSSHFPSDVRNSKLHHELALVGLLDRDKSASPESLGPLPSAPDDATCTALDDLFHGAADVATRLAHLEEACAALHRSTNAIKASLRQQVISHINTDADDDHQPLIGQYRKLCKRKADETRRKLRRQAKAASARKHQQPAATVKSEGLGGSDPLNVDPTDSIA